MKKYFIIGASSDVGIEFLRKMNLLEHQATFYAHYNKNADGIKSITEENGNRIVALKADLSLKEDIQRLIEYILKDDYIPSVIVHMPSPPIDLIKLSDLKWEECIDDATIQVGSAVQIIQALLPHMVKRKERAKIVFLLSENTIIPPAKFMSKYTMSKYMLLGFMKSISVEYQNRNVNINALSPTIIDTKLWSNIDKRMLQMVRETQKMLLPENVAEELIKLVSSESDNMNGLNIHMLG